MITIVNKQSPSAKHDPKVRDFYGRFDDDNVLYIVTRHYNQEVGHYLFGLFNLATGTMYSDPRIDINDIFGNHSDMFYLITKDIKITVG